MFSMFKRLIKKIYVVFRFKKITISWGGNISLRTKFEGSNKLGRYTWFDGDMGFGSYIGDECVINAKIGRYSSIGHKVVVLTGTHPTHNFVSTSPVFYSLAKQNGTTYTSRQVFDEILYADHENRFGIIIGHDVWIGYGVTIMGGIRIGNGAIIAANSFVTENVEPYSIVAGIPSKVIGKRFDDDTIEELNNFGWWNKSEEWLKENAYLFTDVSIFLANQSN